MKQYKILSERKLPLAFYQRNTIDVAKDLLNQYLIHIHDEKTYIGKIVETEAYLGEHGLACHSSKGKTARTEVMFGPAGVTYVYLIYGLHHCFNIVTEFEGVGSAVLIRAVEPISGIEDNTRGPGLLCKAMDITKMQNKKSILSDDLFIARNDSNGKIAITDSARVGVKYAKEWALKPLRFYIKGNPYVSKK